MDFMSCWVKSYDSFCLSHPSFMSHTSFSSLNLLSVFFLPVFPPSCLSFSTAQRASTPDLWPSLWQVNDQEDDRKWPWPAWQRNVTLSASLKGQNSNITCGITVKTTSYKNFTVSPTCCSLWCLWRIVWIGWPVSLQVITQLIHQKSVWNKLWITFHCFDAKSIRWSRPSKFRNLNLFFHSNLTKPLCIYSPFYTCLDTIVKKLLQGDKVLKAAVTQTYCKLDCSLLQSATSTLTRNTKIKTYSFLWKACARWIRGACAAGSRTFCNWMGRCGVSLSLPVTEWFTVHPRMVSPFLPPYFPSLNPTEKFSSWWRWKVYDQQPHDHMFLLNTVNAGCLNISAKDCQGWVKTSSFPDALHERTEGVMRMKTCGQMQKTGLTSTVVFLYL